MIWKQLSMNDKHAVTEISKYLLRFLFQIPSSYAPSGKPHIFLFSTRRSGSTLLRDLIYSQTGFNYIDQPFDLTQYNWHVRQLPQAGLGQFITLTESEAKKVEAYIDGLLKRKFVFRSQWQFWDGRYHWQWERFVVKILTAKSLIHWFENVFENKIKIVYMTRHPIPTSLSIIKRKWPTTTDAYLNNEVFVDSFLTNKMVALAEKTVRSGNLLENHVLNWCLENFIPLKDWQNNDWVTVSYEKLLAEPHASVQRLCSRLGLDEPEKMIATLNIPTRTAVAESRQTILAEGAKTRLDSWQKKIDSKDIGNINLLLETFEIDLYQAHKPLPLSIFDTN